MKECLTDSLFMKKVRNVAILERYKNKIYKINIGYKGGNYCKMKRKRFIQVIVHCNDCEKKADYIERIGLGRIKYKLPMINACVIEISEDKLENIRNIDGMISVELDTHITAQMNRVKDEIECQWAHRRNIKGRGVGVAIVDTGISLHKDFTAGGNRVVAFKDFIHGKREPYDDNGHGPM